MADFLARATRQENGILLSVSDNAVSLLAFAMMRGHPRGLDTLLASLASGVVSDNLRPGFVEAMEVLDIKPTDELVEEMVKHEMGRLDDMVKHGAERGPLLETGRDDIGVTVTIQPLELYLLALTAGSVLDMFEGGSAEFLLSMTQMEALLTPAEQMSIMAADQKPEALS